MKGLVVTAMFFGTHATVTTRTHVQTVEDLAKELASVGFHGCTMKWCPDTLTLNTVEEIPRFTSNQKDSCQNRASSGHRMKSQLQD